MASEAEPSVPAVASSAPKSLSTPHSNHVASGSAYPAKFGGTIDEVDRYIDADLSTTKYCGFDDFLHALGLDPGLLQSADEKLLEIARDDDTLNLRNKYCEDVGNETQRYGPFCELANHIISKLPSQRRPIVFCRNDPRCIKGMFSNDRKPDVVVLEGEDLAVADGKWREHSSNGPRGIKWTWSDVLHAFEFKASKSAILYKDVNVLLPTDAVFGGKADASPQVDIPSSSAPADAPPPVKIGSATASAGRSSVAARTVPSKARVMSGSLASGSTDRPSSCASSGKKRMMDEDDSEGPNSKKARREGPRKNVMKQAARYAIDKLSYDANMRHTISGFIDNGIIRMCYYDRAGVVCSRGLRFVDDLYRFVLLIKALVELSPEDRGIMERMRRIIPGDDADDTCSSDEDVESDAASSDLTSLSDEDSQDSGLKIGDPCWELLIGTHKVWIYRPISRRRPYGLTGRAGRVDAAKCESLNPTKPNRVMAIKTSWPAARRTSEVQIITWAREVLDELDKEDAFRKENGIEEGRKLSDCLPKVLASDDLENLEENGFRKRLGADFEDNRIFRAIVFEVLFPVYEVVDLSVYKRLFREIVQGHHFLFTASLLTDSRAIKHCDIKHRDISVENVMYRILPDGTLRGVLNDWDLAKVGSSKEENPKGTRTGTRPFMAIDLLEAEPPDHVERFDWESIFYVLLWIGCHYINGREIEGIVFVDWLEHDLGKLKKFKRSDLGDFDFKKITDHFKPLVHLWLKPLQLLFRAGYDAQSDCPDGEPFVGETLQGHVTYAKVWNIFKRD
ncbi:hypothetical protein M0805_001250 [Coniferiporia weirii]|nr:hypothetical protein M0805_001250 [Coniferiporia weirii]